MHNPVICCARSISHINHALTYLLHSFYRCVTCDFGDLGKQRFFPYSQSRERFLLDEPPTFARSPTFGFRSRCTRSLPFRIMKTCGYSFVNFSSLAFEDRKTRRKIESGIEIRKHCMYLKR